MALAGGGKSFNLQKVQKSTVFSIIKLYVQRRKKKKKTAHEGHSPRTQTYYKTDLFIGLENVFSSHILPPNQQGSRVITMDYWLKD